MTDLTKQIEQLKATERVQLLEATEHALARWRALQAETDAELDSMKDRPLTRHEHARHDDLTELARQIEHGLNANDGTDPRLARLVQDPAVVRLGLAKPGIQSLERLRTRLLAEQGDAAAKARQTWPQRFRYTGLPGKAYVDGRRLQPGDIVELNEAQAEAFADRFKPVERETVTG